MKNTKIIVIVAFTLLISVIANPVAIAADPINDSYEYAEEFIDPILNVEAGGPYQAIPGALIQFEGYFDLLCSDIVNITGYTWDFGDGESFTHDFNPVISTINSGVKCNAGHIYINDGNYLATLIIHYESERYFSKPLPPNLIVYHQNVDTAKVTVEYDTWDETEKPSYYFNKKVEDDENGWVETTSHKIGDTIRFNITYNAPGRIENVEIRDYLPSTVRYVTSSRTPNSIEPKIYFDLINNVYVPRTLLTWDIGDMHAGESVEIIIEGEVEYLLTKSYFGIPDDGYPIDHQTENFAVLEGTGHSPGCGNAYHVRATATADFTIVTCTPGIMIEKFVKWNCLGITYGNYIYAHVEDWVTFKLEVTNNGDVPLDVTVSDSLPIGCFVYNNNAMVDGVPHEPDDVVTPLNGHVIYVWYLDDVQPDQTVIITFRAVVDDCGELVNTVTVTGAYKQYEPVVDDDSATVFVLCPAINIVKDVDKPVIYEGEMVTYTYTVANTGNCDLYNVVVDDDQGLTPIRVSGDDGDNVLQTIETWIYEATTSIADDVTNIGSVTAEDELGEQVYDEDDATVNVSCEPKISVDKQVKWNCYGEYGDSIVVDKGDWVTFKINVTNNGTIPLNVTVTDILPECLHYTDDATVDGKPFEPEGLCYCVMGLPGEKCHCSYKWEIGMLDPEETVVITFTADTDDCCGEVVNLASAIGYIEPQHIDFVVSRDIATVNVLCPPDLEVTKTVFNECDWSDETTADIGEKVRFRVVVKNTGLAPLYNFTAIDTLPAGLTYADNAIVDGFSDEPDEIILNPDGTTTLIWNFLCPTCDSRCQLYPVIPDPCGGNGVFVPCNPECCGLCYPRPADPDPQPYPVGVQCGYCAKIPVPVCDKRCETVNMFDPRVQEPDWVYCNPECCWGDGPVPISGVCGYNSGDITPCLESQPCCPCECFELYPDETIVIEFDAIVDDCGVLENNMVVTSNDKITDEQLIDEDNATVNVPCGSDISVEKYVKWDCTPPYEKELYITPQQLEHARWVTFKLYVNNTGDTPLDISVRDELPSGLTYADSASPKEYDYNDGNEYYWNFTGVQPGASIVITFRASINECGEFENVANVTGKYECQTVYDQSSATVNVPCGSDISVEKYVKWDCTPPYEKELYITPQQLEHARWVTFKLYVNNTGDTPLDISVRDELPSGLTYADSASPKEYDYNDGNEYYWNFTGVQPGASIVITFRASINECGEFENVANVTGKYECQTVYDQSSATVNVPCAGCVTSISIDKKIYYDGEWSDNLDVQTNENHINVTFKITVENTGTCDLESISIIDTYECGIENLRDFTGDFTDYEIISNQIFFSVNEPFTSDADPLVIMFNATVYISTLNHVEVFADSTYDETQVHEQDTVSIILGEVVNNKPYKPVNPNPENLEENISVDPLLSVYIEDPDGDLLDVDFFNASDDSLIGSLTGRASDTRAEINWNDLDYETVYSWYVVVDDGEYTNTSDVFTFKTKKDTGLDPTVEITTPEPGSIYFRGNHILAAFLDNALVIGGINITVDANDTDGEITNIDFIIDGEIKNSTTNTYYYWNEICFGWRTITVRVTDNMGNTAEDEIDVFMISRGL